jgi:hypothetical protein
LSDNSLLTLLKNGSTRKLHHLDRAAGKSKLHPHERAGSRPGNEIIGRGAGPLPWQGARKMELSGPTIVTPTRELPAAHTGKTGGAARTWFRFPGVA